MNQLTRSTNPNRSNLTDEEIKEMLRGINDAMEIEVEHGTIESVKSKMKYYDRIKKNLK